jgi:hypothetical protein
MGPSVLRSISFKLPVQSYMSPISEETYPLELCALTMRSIIADALLIYRCYVIWNTYWITVVPIMLLIPTMSASRYRSRRLLSDAHSSGIFYPTSVVLYTFAQHEPVRPNLSW